MNQEQIKSAMMSYAQITQIYGELKQDAFILAVTQSKANGYFVEFGAMTGKEYSNTYLLEKGYGWQGIVSEPNPRFHDSLYQNRSCVIDNRAVFDSTGESLEFVCAGHGYSGIKSFTSHNGDTIQVESVTLVDLLVAHNAPNYIDYISADTEGSELRILQAFDFDRYRVGAWTIEHNYTPARQPIYDLMTANGYVRMLTEISEYDDWYVHSSLIS
jgi:FkbM family methyltransferase